MLVGYITRRSVTGGGDNAGRCVRKMALPPAPSRAWLRSAAVSANAPELCVLLLLSFPLKSVVREVTVQVNLEIVGLVSFLFCVFFFVFFFLSFTCTAFAVDTITYTLFCREC